MTDDWTLVAKEEDELGKGAADKDRLLFRVQSLEDELREVREEMRGLHTRTQNFLIRTGLPVGFMPTFSTARQSARDQERDERIRKLEHIVERIQSLPEEK